MDDQLFWTFQCNFWRQNPILRSRFNNRTGCNVSERTVRRRLCFVGYKRRMICKKITISRVNRDRRMGFCRQKLHWNVQNNWSSIIFSDKTEIMLGRNGKVYVWRKPDERFRPDYFGQLPELDDFETTCRASVMFWGCVLQCLSSIPFHTPKENPFILWGSFFYDLHFSDYFLYFPFRVSVLKISE
jgi:hypothetical protein